ncbi:MAG: helix-turn-helix transcriptional regulator [Pseudomonadota bacterium]
MPDARDQHLIEAFASVLRDARAKIGASQESLAEAVGVDRTYIGLLEAGKRQPTLSVICGLALAFGQSPGALIQRVHKLSLSSKKQK